MPNLRVDAWDDDLILDDWLGQSAATDAEGRYAIEFDNTRFRAVSRTIPGLVLQGLPWRRHNPCSDGSFAAQCRQTGCRTDWNRRDLAVRGRYLGRYRERRHGHPLVPLKGVSVARRPAGCRRQRTCLRQSSSRRFALGPKDLQAVRTIRNPLPASALQSQWRQVRQSVYSGIRCRRAGTKGVRRTFQRRRPGKSRFRFVCREPPANLRI